MNTSLEQVLAEVARRHERMQYARCTCGGDFSHHHVAVEQAAAVRSWLAGALTHRLIRPTIDAEKASAVQAALDEHGTRPWRKGDADSRCQDCGHRYVPWFTDHWLWNQVVGGPEATDDPGGYLCATCFTIRAEAIWPNQCWRLFPQWHPPRAEGARTDG